jgi:hypothetical protein
LADGIATFGYIGAVLIAISFLFKQFVIDQNYSLTNLMNYLSHWQLALKDLVTSVILAIIVIVVAVPEVLRSVLFFPFLLITKYKHTRNLSIHFLSMNFGHFVGL